MNGARKYRGDREAVCCCRRTLNPSIERCGPADAHKRSRAVGEMEDGPAKALYSADMIGVGLVRRYIGQKNLKGCA